MFTGLNRPAPHSASVVLVSGGLDSAVALALAKANTCDDLFALTFDYGQRHVKEVACAHALAKHFKARFHVFGLDALRALGGLRPEDDVLPGARTSKQTGSLAECDADIPLLPKTWKPGRNILFLAFAGAFAWWVGAHLIVTGIHQEDQPAYPDCQRSFLQYMELVLQQGLSYTVSLWTPLLEMNKPEIVTLGSRLRVPFEKTWTCYVGESEPCGSCDACIRRARAFHLCSLKDPLK